MFHYDILEHPVPQAQTLSAFKLPLQSLVLLVLLVGLWLAAAATTVGASPCEERAPEGAEVPLPRLPGLRYDCLSLAGSRPLLVGRAGSPGAPMVLLVHGLGQSAHRDWAPVVGELAQRFQVTTVDLPGFGASPAPGRAYDFDELATLLARLLDQLAPGRRVHVVGHSLGAALSLAFAHRYPERVDRLVLVDAAGILLKPIYVRALTQPRVPRFGLPPLDRVLRFMETRVNELSSLLLLGRDDRYDFLPWLTRNPDVRSALLGDRVQVDAALGLVEHDFSAAIRETRAPTTVIWGRDDRIAPLRTGRLLAARLPQAQLRVLDDAGHTPMLDRPGSFNSLLLAALVGPPPQREAENTTLAGEPSQGDVVCDHQDELRYSGGYDSLRLESCGQIDITQARIGQLVVNNSTVSVVDSTITNDDVAVLARDSEVTATAVRISGRVAIRSDNSYFDLAGVSLQARERGVELIGERPSRLFFSVSDWQGSDYRGDAHFIWPRVGEGR